MRDHSRCSLRDSCKHFSGPPSSHHPNNQFSNQAKIYCQAYKTSRECFWFFFSYPLISSNFNLTHCTFWEACLHTPKIDHHTANPRSNEHGQDKLIYVLIDSSTKRGWNFIKNLLKNSKGRAHQATLGIHVNNGTTNKQVWRAPTTSQHILPSLAFIKHPFRMQSQRPQLVAIVQQCYADIKIQVGTKLQNIQRRASLNAG